MGYQISSLNIYQYISIYNLTVVSFLNEVRNKNLSMGLITELGQKHASRIFFFFTAIQHTETISFSQGLEGHQQLKKYGKFFYDVYD